MCILVEGDFLLYKIVHHSTMTNRFRLLVGT